MAFSLFKGRIADRHSPGVLQSGTRDRFRLWRGGASGATHFPFYNNFGSMALSTHPRGSDRYRPFQDFLAASASIASTMAEAHCSATLRRYFSVTLSAHPALITKSVRR